MGGVFDALKTILENYNYLKVAFINNQTFPG
jgi:hypothetical protein